MDYSKALFRQLFESWAGQQGFGKTATKVLWKIKKKAPASSMTTKKLKRVQRRLAERRAFILRSVKRSMPQVEPWRPEFAAYCKQCPCGDVYDFRRPNTYSKFCSAKCRLRFAGSPEHAEVTAQTQHKALA